MHHLNKSDTRGPWRSACLAVACGLGLAAMASAQTPAAEPSSAPRAERRVNVDEYIVRGNTVLDQRSIERALAPFLGPDRSMKDIEDARDALLAVYQAKGYQSVYVDLPEQQVTEGLVFLQVNETKVGRLRVVGAEFSSPLAVREQVPALKEGEVPDFTQAQAELTAINRGGKRTVTPLVRQGSLPGTMDVDLKVEDSSPWHASAGVNNDHGADTSELRATASLTHDNLWQLGHGLSLSFFGAPQDLKETQVWSGSYTVPVKDSNWSVEASGYLSDSDVATLGGTNAIGKGHSLGLKATYSVAGEGAWWHSFSVGADFKDNEEALRLAGAGDSYSLKYAPITLAYSGFAQGERAQGSFGLSLVAGTRSLFGYGSDALAFDYKRYKASPSFLVLKVDSTGAYTFGGQRQLGWRLAWQMTDGPLVSSEQIAAGGMNSVRGYLASESTGDYGLVGSLELRSAPLTFLGPMVEAWRAYAFGDVAQVRLRDPLPEQQSSFPLASIGLGTSLKVGPYVNGRLDVGYPVKAGVRTERHDTRVNFSVSASY